MLKERNFIDDPLKWKPRSVGLNYPGPLPIKVSELVVLKRDNSSKFDASQLDQSPESPIKGNSPLSESKREEGPKNNNKKPKKELTPPPLDQQQDDKPSRQHPVDRAQDNSPNELCQMKS